MPPATTPPNQLPPERHGPRGDEPNPYSDPIAYLNGHGWRCLGNPDWPSALWLDPTQPLKAYYSTEPCTYTITTQETYRDPNSGENKVRFKDEQRQILGQDGNGGQNQLAFRQVYHPKVTPVLIGQALMTQLERDAFEQQKQLVRNEESKAKKSA